MAYLKILMSLCSLILGASAAPTNSTEVSMQLSSRQANELPPNALYLIEWYPHGCGNGNGVSLSGDESTLGTCVKFDGIHDRDDPDKLSVRFLWPKDDDRTFKWRLFSTNDCSEQIEEGEMGSCYTVDNSARIGAVIVYT